MRCVVWGGWVRRQARLILGANQKCQTREPQTQPCTLHTYANRTHRLRIELMSSGSKIVDCELRCLSRPVWVLLPPGTSDGGLGGALPLSSDPTRERRPDAAEMEEDSGAGAASGVEAPPSSWKRT